MFDHIPGFMMFRDPTKWYTLIALSYSFLIPFTISQVYFRFKNSVQIVTLVIFVVFWAFTTRQAVIRQLGGTFAWHKIPYDYQQFEGYISQDSQFYRTLWIPETSHLPYSTYLHPAMSGVLLPEVASASAIFQFLSEKNTPFTLSRLGIRYLIVPYDYENKIFLTDRVYDNSKYENTVGQLRSLSWVKQKTHFGKIAIFETQSYNDQFWLEENESHNTNIHISAIKPTQYTVTVPLGIGERTLIFSQSFDPGWKAVYNGKTVYSKATYDHLNSFAIPKVAQGDISVLYEPQELVNRGLWVSAGATVIVLGSLFVLLRKIPLITNKRKHNLS